MMNSVIPEVARFFIMCQIIGFWPISNIGLGFDSDASRIRVPNPPARITAGITQIPPNLFSGHNPFRKVYLKHGAN